MRRAVAMLVAVLLAGTVWGAPAEGSDSRTRAVLSGLDALWPELDALYRELHAHPELSLQEKETAARLAGRLRAAGVEVTTGVGGHGVVGVLRNGDGPTVLLRAVLRLRAIGLGW